MYKTKLFLTLSLLSTLIFAETGLEIMERLDNQPTPDNVKATLTMTLRNKRGQTRSRTIQRFQKEYKTGEFSNKSLIFFLEPADERGTGFLQWNYAEAGKDDDQWLYLPALGREKRIAAAEKSSEFMGTDFTYDDMGDRDINKYSYTLMGEENLGDEACWKIEALAKDKSQAYQKLIYWISKEKIQPLQMYFFDKRGDQVKTLTFSEYKKIDGFWMAMQMHMVNSRKQHQTSLSMKDVDLKTVQDDNLFTIRLLKRGIQ